MLDGALWCFWGTIIFFFHKPLNHCSLFFHVIVDGLEDIVGECMQMFLYHKLGLGIHQYQFIIDMGCTYSGRVQQRQKSQTGIGRGSGQSQPNIHRKRWSLSQQPAQPKRPLQPASFNRFLNPQNIEQQIKKSDKLQQRKVGFEDKISILSEVSSIKSASHS